MLSEICSNFGTNTSRWTDYMGTICFNWLIEYWYFFTNIETAIWLTYGWVYDFVIRFGWKQGKERFYSEENIRNQACKGKKKEGWWFDSCSCILQASTFLEQRIGLQKEFEDRIKRTSDGVMEFYQVLVKWIVKKLEW